ncbi:MAG: hypothetical protein MAG581_02393 [Deltaproteobacteria bacterium]|nr:hypothetical protein [Deltaproteobacteria bacterium]
MKKPIILIILIIVSFSFKPNLDCLAAESETTPANEVYVVNHGWHTGFVVAAPDIQQIIPELKQRFGNIPYLEFGWGDSEFYQAEETTTGITLKAIFFPSDSVVHAVAVPTRADKYFQQSEVEKFCLGDAEFSSLLEFISGSFFRDEPGKVQQLKHGIYGDSQFYQGVGDFHIFNTCNKWTARGLERAGLDISTTFKLTAGSIMNYLSENDYSGRIELNQSCKK